MSLGATSTFTMWYKSEDNTNDADGYIFYSNYLQLLYNPFKQRIKIIGVGAGAPHESAIESPIDLSTFTHIAVVFKND